MGAYKEKGARSFVWENKKKHEKAQ